MFGIWNGTRGKLCAGSGQSWEKRWEGEIRNKKWRKKISVKGFVFWQSGMGS